MAQQKTSLAAAISSAGQSSITITEHLGFPASGAFSILIDAEVLRVTAGNGTTTWTVTRGYGGTTATTHSNGATITHVPEAYAELGEGLATMALDGTARYELVLDLLGDVTRDIDAHNMRSFLPLAADVTVYVDVVMSGCDRLTHAADGFTTTDGRALDITAVTNLYVRDSETAAYVEVAAGDTGYYLEPGPAGTGVAGTDWPWEDISLSPEGTYPTWPRGKRAVKIIGRIGTGPAIPRPYTRGTISEMRERFRQSIGGGPSPIGVTGFGTPIFLTGDSPDMRRILRHPYSRRPDIG